MEFALTSFQREGRIEFRTLRGSGAMLSASDAWRRQIKVAFAGFLAVTLAGCFLTS
jgi:hypothetical protein